ncbi:MAG: hypothetical protein JST11_12820 [Acidobacteria bacterium]|nr:hypothetical protein [Acidobacteriota bacterium]
MIDSAFLNNLIGGRVRVLCKDHVGCGDAPVLILREVSPLGIVGEAAGEQHFFPWTEVIEISACNGAAEMEEELVPAIFVDSEP